MTIKQRENIQNLSQQDKLLVFDKKSGKLRDTAETELLQVTNVQQKLWKTLWHAASHRKLVDDHSQYVAENSTQNRKLEDKGKYSSEERESDIEHVNEINKTDGGSDHLLILAHSAELMWESDSLDGSHGNDHSNEGFCTTSTAQNSSESVSHATVTDHKSPGKEIEGMSVIDHMRGEEDGFHGGGRTPRLTHIRRQARLPSNLLVQHRLGECTAGNLQGKRIRLTQIRHQARCKKCSPKYSCGDSQGRIIRLSELRRQARLKTNLLVEKTIENQVNRHLDCQTSEDNRRKRIITDIFGEEDGSKAGADFHLSEVDCVQEYNVNVGIDKSVPVINEVQDKKILVKGRKQLSQLRCEACLGNVGTSDGETELLHS